MSKGGFTLLSNTQNQALYELQKELWGYAEPGFLEHRSAAAMSKFLRQEGFTVTEGICGMETAFVGVWGSGHPVICLLAEFDALYGLSQEADVSEYKPIEGVATGHGCGHHLLGTGSIAAAMMVKDYLEKNKLSGTIKMVGCPAEESGSGKAYLARDGFFDDADAAITWHPSTLNVVSSGSNQSCIQCYFRFHGVSSHAAGNPEAGRSALDAVELMSVGVNYLREHMDSKERVHYAYTNAGGISPNVVQAEAEVKYLVRSTTNPKCQKLYERVINIAKGAAMMTGTTCDVIFDEGLSNVIPNFTLEQVLEDAFFKVGVPAYTEAERAYAKQFRDTYPLEPESEVTAVIAEPKALIANIQNSDICDIILRHRCVDECSMGSTDVGDVSWVVPTAQINTACYSYGAGGHTWQWVAQGKSTLAYKGMMLAAEVMAQAVEACFEHPEIIEKAKAEFEERLAGQAYECLIPKDVKPHIIQ
ncbi:amidohydrolase [Holdemania massiliensis]|uniref:Amidohydrolase n=1 Tax=Holdemania massiliensis TaxID=1468449 RepID=A0A6N7SBQ3_9FIRM|nr:amidohydrolase [Holdemania massiliensis]MSA91055.1 amidohydrolase [Holdemania massiliensis]MSB79905.1 amidohydrolase [Holdemania massiliensis]MSC34826.1 amidohydrolase [Holdemania massiliensis]MSC41215.1 amidohydrolase [Holdemania massiliensis]